jgi:hypothetical protein
MTPPALRAKQIIRADPDRLEPMIAQEIFDAIDEVLAELGRGGGQCPVCSAPVYWVRYSVSTRFVPRSRWRRLHGLVPGPHKAAPARVRSIER